MAAKLASAHKKPREYALSQAHAIYMQSKDPNAMPQLIDMAEMFAAKYLKDGHMEGLMQDYTNAETGETTKLPPQFFVQLTFQIML